MTRGKISDINSFAAFTSFDYFGASTINYHFYDQQEATANGYPVGITDALNPDGGNLLLGGSFVDIQSTGDVSAFSFQNLIRSTFDSIGEFANLTFQENTSQVSDINFAVDDQRARVQVGPLAFRDAAGITVTVY